MEKKDTERTATVNTQTEPLPTVDIDRLVVDMIYNGFDNVPRPEGMEEGDFRQIQMVVRSLDAFYPKNAVGIARRKDHRVLGGQSMIDLMECGDYQGADDYVAYVCDFVPI